MKAKIILRIMLVCFCGIEILDSTSAAAQSKSLYSGPPPSPGPSLLYAAPADVPQLQNTGIWKAAPILVSGATAYRDGEFLYQDFLFDDTGASEVADPNDPRSNGNMFSKPNGTYTYPTNPAYANNAADLVEFRVKPLSEETAFRITLNTMTDPTLIAISIALGGAPGSSHPFPHGANVSAPADFFLTIFPSGTTLVADLVNASDGTLVSGATPTVAVDTVRRQIEVRVAHSQWDPTGQVVSLAAGIGLWDNVNRRYLLPQATASATSPGGAGTALSPPAFFNVAFRNNEPMPDAKDPANSTTSPAWWRDQAQAQALATGDITALHAEVDFNKLATHVDDETGVPQTGAMDRILGSHFETMQGAQFTACFPSAERTCAGAYQSRLQPYAIYIPKESPPPTGYGLTLLLHSLSTNYNQYLSSRNQSEYGERGPGSIVITPESRGPDGFYVSYAGADVFEVWADVASRYPLNPSWTAITGYSMGGIGTFKLAQQFPDLFARAQSTVGFSQNATSSNSNATGQSLLPSMRNIPVLMWNMAVDELVPATSYLPTANTLDSLGYEYELDVFATGDHLTLAINDEYGPAATFLGTATVSVNPPHLTYVYDPAIDDPALSFVADHAYWLSGLQLRSTATPIIGGDATGTIDAFSFGFGVGDPVPSGTQHGTGVLTGGTIPDMAFTRQFQTLGAVPSIPTANRIDLKATNINAVTINVQRAQVDCNVDLHITSDGPITVQLEGCNRTIAQ